MKKQWLICGLIVALAAAVAPGQSKKGAGRWRNNVNLPGGDYMSIDMDTSDPSGCKAACERDGRCKAWTFVKPETEGGRGYCWLKDSVPAPIREDCCVSALKGEGVGGGVGTVGKATGARWRDNVNLPGGDFMSIDMDTADPTGCKAACEKEGRCKAWTFVKPETEGGRGYCWLKDSVPAPIREECCVSALKGEGVGGGGAGGWTGPVASWREGVDLPGGDYRSIEMKGVDAGPCQAACERQGRCKAWTFVKADTPEGMGMCWLKETVPEAVNDGCCVSALKGEGGATARRDERRGRRER